MLSYKIVSWNIPSEVFVPRSEICVFAYAYNLRLKSYKNKYYVLLDAKLYKVQYCCNNLIVNFRNHLSWVLDWNYFPCQGVHFQMTIFTLCSIMLVKVVPSHVLFLQDGCVLTFYWSKDDLTWEMLRHQLSTSCWQGNDAIL